MHTIAGVGLFMESDLEIILQMIASNPTNSTNNNNGQSPPTNTPSSTPNNPTANTTNNAHWETRIQSFMASCEGAYSLAILTRDALFATRDYLGMRPLCIGEIPIDNEKKGYMVASESCAIDIIG